MSIYNEEALSGLRTGLLRRHVVDSYPPAGLINWPPATELPQNVNVCNAIVTNVLVGENCDVMKFADWCNTTPHRITVIPLASKAQRKDSHMSQFLRQAMKMSLIMVLFNNSGQRERSQVLDRASAESRNADSQMQFRPQSRRNLSCRFSMIRSSWSTGG